MRKFLDWIDDIAEIGRENKSAAWLERAAFVFLILMVLSAPHSIAATQTAWLMGTAVFIARLFINPRPKLIRTPLDFALWAFFGWTVVTSIFSYAPDISINKLRGALLFLIFYFVVNNLRSVRAAKFLAFALIFSCMASVAWAPFERIYGRGVEISGVDGGSIFTKAVHFDHDTYLRAKGRNLPVSDDAGTTEKNNEFLIDGDTVLEAGGRKIRTPDELLAEIEKNEITYLECFRTPYYFTLKVRRADLSNGATALEKLGIGDWKHNRSWRYSGFYSQIITYAEVLQMIASLALGLFIALDRKRSKTGALLILCLALMISALLLTFTRASQSAFLASAAAMFLTFGNRKTLLISAAVILPLALAGLVVMQQIRNVGFFDRSETSVSYRQTVYGEGVDLWTRSPRNFLLGVGMDSTKRFASEWNLFEGGRLPMGHFHSTPLQLLVERGLPALALWLWIFWLYARMLLRKNSRLQITDYELREENNPKSEIRNLKPSDWQIQGIILGCFGALVGFFVSSLVNYSLGDGEVAMVFYILMGIGVSLCLQNLPVKNVPISSSR